MSKLNLYLAGAIRDDHPHDIEWRDSMVRAFDLWCPSVVNVLNPLAGKTYCPSTKEWKLCDRSSDSKMIVSNDFYCVDHSDVIVFNFLPLSEGYPSIGTLSEWGRSTARDVLRYIIVKPKFTGHENKMFSSVHPFLLEPATAVFTNTDECTDFLVKYLPCLRGKSLFRGYA